MLLAVGAAIVLAAALIGASLASRGGGGKPPQALIGAPETEELLAGIPQRGTTLGSPDAPVTLVEYADLQCPYCAEWALNALPELIDDYVRPGRLRIQFHGMQFLGPDSERGLAAVIAAGRQDRAWHAVDLLFRNQGTENSGWLDARTVERVAASIDGIDAEQMVDDARSDQVATEARESEASANAAGIDSTPSFQVGRTGGALERVQVRSLDAAGLRPAIEAALAG